MKYLKKLAAIILTLAMLVSALPAMSFAAVETTVETDLSQVTDLEARLASSENLIKGYARTTGELAVGNYKITLKSTGANVGVNESNISNLTNGTAADTHADINGFKFLDSEGNFIDNAVDFTFMLPGEGEITDILMAAASQNIPTMYTEDYTVFIGNDLDTLYTPANEKYNYINTNSTAGQLITFGEAQMGQYIGIRVNKGVGADCEIQQNGYNPSSMRMREIAVFGQCDVEMPEVMITAEISSVANLATRINSTENIVLGYGLSNYGTKGTLSLTHVVSGNVEKLSTTGGDTANLTNGIYVKDKTNDPHVDIGYRHLDDDGNYIKDDFDITFSFPGVATVNSMLIAGSCETAKEFYTHEYAVFASDSLETLYLEANKKAYYLNTYESSEQYISFNTPVEANYIGIRIYKAVTDKVAEANRKYSRARFREIAIFGEVDIPENFAIVDAKINADTIAELGTAKNLMNDGYGFDFDPNPGTVCFRSSTPDVKGAFASYDTEFDLLDGKTNKHIDIRFRPDTLYVDSANNLKSDVYTDVITTLRHEATLDKLFVSLSPQLGLRATEYDIYFSTSYDTLFNAINRKITFRQTTDIYQNQTFKFDAPITAKYVGIRILKGVEPTYNSGANNSYARLSELGIFGEYNIPYFDYTVDIPGLSITDGRAYEGQEMIFQAPALNSENKPFGGFNIDGETSYDAKTDSYSVEFTATEDFDLKATYTERYGFDGFGFFRKDNMMRLPLATADANRNHFMNAESTISFSRDNNDLLDGDYVKTGDKISVKYGDEEFESAEIVTAGDINLDGQLTATDLVMGVDMLFVGGTSKSEFAADTNNDGLVTVSDIVDIRSKALYYYPDYSQRTVDIKDTDFKPLGRTEMKADQSALLLEMTGSGFDFNAYCQGDITLDVKLSTNGGNPFRYYTVLVDGIRSEVKMRRTGELQQIVIAENLDATLHNIQFLKQTQGGETLEVSKITLNGETAYRSGDSGLYIEFVGDSITCGEGNLIAKGGSYSGNIRGEDGTRSYSTLTANMLGADYGIISRGGSSLVDDRDRAPTRLHMPTEYEKVSISSENSWDFTAHRSDIVVVNLGTNDEGVYGSREELMNLTTDQRVDHFAGLAYDFAKRIIELNGDDVRIVFAFGMMTAPSRESGTSEHFAFRAYQKAAQMLQDEGYNGFYVRLPYGADGGAGHPSAANDITAAEALTEFIQTQVLN